MDRIARLRAAVSRILVCLVAAPFGIEMDLPEGDGRLDGELVGVCVQVFRKLGFGRI